ncbi:unnamed protein product [Didymodactylos carnosus]|uniref:Metalloenzyme domain-containing protein n=1 Tax=Didymodactylos carnosus TaxID=1234261 RepID=A0A8S2H7F5_9BILA|nr:unnamed protein product [Didymodactylos carnosus]CAF3609514.1 unnamed protein product [Didymodactylos carnosus]
MMNYEGIDADAVAYPPTTPTYVLGEVLANAGLTQLRVAETEKYAHVTFFFDGGLDQEYTGAHRVMVPSVKVPTYDLHPAMSAKEITDVVIERMNAFDVVIVNYANPDMVGHTGKLGPTMEAIKIMDSEIGRLHDRLRSLGGTLVITADHGNAEVMEADGQPCTMHTTSDVPFIVTDERIKLATQGSLIDVAPTLLSYLGVEAPVLMTGRSLIK